MIMKRTPLFNFTHLHSYVATLNIWLKMFLLVSSSSKNITSLPISPLRSLPIDPFSRSDRGCNLATTSRETSNCSTIAMFKPGKEPTS